MMIIKRNMSELLNISSLNEDPFEDHTSDSPLEENMHKTTYKIFFYFTYFTEALKIFLDVTVCVADIYLLSTMRRDRNKCRTKKLIMHYAISHVIRFLCSALAYFLYLIDSLEKTVYFSIWSMEQFCIVIGLYIGVGIGIEWLVIVYNPILNKYMKLFYNQLTSIFYGLSLLQFFIDFCYSIAQSQYWYASAYIFRLIIFTSVVFLLICNYIKYKNKIILPHKKAYGLIVANIIVFSWVPLYGFDTVLPFTTRSKVLHALVLLLWFIPERLAFGNSLFILFVLGKYDIYFQKYYDKLFIKCAKYRDDEEYLNEEFNENSLKNNNSLYENRY